MCPSKKIYTSPQPIHEKMQQHLKKHREPCEYDLVKSWHEYIYSQIVHDKASVIHYLAKINHVTQLLVWSATFTGLQANQRTQQINNYPRNTSSNLQKFILHKLHYGPLLCHNILVSIIARIIVIYLHTRHLSST